MCVSQLLTLLSLLIVCTFMLEMKCLLVNIERENFEFYQDIVRTFKFERKNHKEE